MIVTYNENNVLDTKAIGPSLFYEQNSDLFRKVKHNKIIFKPHNFMGLILGKTKLPSLYKNDVVFSNVGPYAWFYHYLRRKRGQKFRIIRDVRTALHSDFIFQETLCTSLMQDGDAVLFPSEYSRKLFLKLFPDKLNEENTFLCYPSLFDNLPKISKDVHKGGGEGELVLGWIGRVFATKNFKQAIDIFVNLYDSMKDIKVKMLVGGTADSEFKPEIVKGYLRRIGVNPDSYVHVNNGSFVQYNDIWRLLEKMDVFLFPSVGNMESFGRTIIEANHAGVPVIASEHGACPELIDLKNLVGVKYSDETFYANKCVSMGDLFIDEAIKKCKNARNLSKKNNKKRYENHLEKMLKIFQDGKVKEQKIELNHSVKKFIKNVRIFLGSDMNSNCNELLDKSVDLIHHYAMKNQIRVTFPISEIQRELDYRLFSRVC